MDERFEIVSLAETPREDFANFYAELQIANPIMMSLCVEREDLFVYGGAIYDACVLPPCVSVAARLKADKTFCGAYASCLTHYFAQIDPEDVLRCAPHCAFAQHYQKTILAKWMGEPDREIFYQLFGGVREQYLQHGLFYYLSAANMVNNARFGGNYGWGFTVSVDMVKKGIMKKAGTPAGVVKNNVPSGYLEDWIGVLMGLPVNILQNMVRVLEFIRLVAPKTPMVVTDVRDFCYKGRYPFKTPTTCIVMLYEVRVRELPPSRL